MPRAVKTQPTLGKATTWCTSGRYRHAQTVRLLLPVQHTAADLAVALQTLLRENNLLMAELRPNYAQAASAKSPAELSRNYPDAKKLSGDGGKLRCCQAILVQLITSSKVRLQQCTESQGKQVDACGMLCLKGQAFVTFTHPNNYSKYDQVTS